MEEKFWHKFKKKFLYEFKFFSGVDRVIIRTYDILCSWWWPEDYVSVAADILESIFLRLWDFKAPTIAGSSDNEKLDWSNGNKSESAIETSSPYLHDNPIGALKLRTIGDDSPLSDFMFSSGSKSGSAESSGASFKHIVEPMILTEPECDEGIQQDVPQDFEPADELLMSYEIYKDNHPLTIDFLVALTAADLI